MNNKNDWKTFINRLSKMSVSIIIIAIIFTLFIGENVKAKELNEYNVGNVVVTEIKGTFDLIKELEKIKLLEEEAKNYRMVTPKEFEILCKATESEATGEGYEGKIRVAMTILNRVDSNEFPNSIYDVVFQKNAFSVISDGRYYSVSVTDETIDAVNDALKGKFEYDALWFNTKNCTSSYPARIGRDLIETFGNHTFYR